MRHAPHPRRKHCRINAPTGPQGRVFLHRQARMRGHFGTGRAAGRGISAPAAGVGSPTPPGGPRAGFRFGPPLYMAESPKPIGARRGRLGIRRHRGTKTGDSAAMWPVSRPQGHPCVAASDGAGPSLSSVGRSTVPRAARCDQGTGLDGGGREYAEISPLGSDHRIC
jgi:hypothetical protein